jgi:nucleotide-binding universal stress UspA family protein
MILSVAGEDDPSLIAMNAKGTNLLREVFLGSTTFTVVRRATRAVLVTRT